MWVRYTSLALPFFELTHPGSSTMDHRELSLVSGQIRGAVLQIDNSGRYLKQEIESSADERFARVLWHPEDSSKLILATPCMYAFFIWDISLIHRLSSVVPANLRMGDLGIGNYIPE